MQHYAVRIGAAVGYMVAIHSMYILPRKNENKKCSAINIRVFGIFK